MEKPGTPEAVPAPSIAPVLGASLGFAPASPGPTPQSPPPRAGPPAEVPRPRDRESAQLGRATMLGVAPQAGPIPLELEDITSDAPAAPSSGSADLPLPVRAEQRDWGLPELVGPKAGPPRLNRAVPRAEPSIDLPAAAPPRRVAHEAPVSAGLPALALDLPRKLGAVRSGSDMEVDLPDLGASLPVVGAGLPDLAMGLPELGAGLPELGAGLPEPGAGLPDAFGLPAGIAGSTFGGMGGGSHGDGPNSIQLPSYGPQGGANSEDDFGADDIFGGAPPGHASDDLFGTGPTHRAVTDPTGLVQPTGPGQPAGGYAGDEDEFDAFPTETGQKPRATSTSTGGVGYGEVALDGGVGDLSLGENLERPRADGNGPGTVAGPGMTGPGGAAATAVVTRPGAHEVAPKKVKQKAIAVSRSVRIAAIAAGVTVLVGGALSAVPSVGPFGAYRLIDLVRGGHYAETLGRDLKSAELQMSADRATDWDAAFRLVDRGREDAPRFRPRAALAAYIGLVRQLKYGSDTRSGAEAKALLDGLAEADPAEVPYLDAARLAAKAAERRGKDALLPDAKVRSSREHTFLAAEVLTREGYAQKAQALWQDLLKLGPTVRSELGYARSLSLQGNDADAQKQVDAILGQSPGHIGASLLAVELALKRRGDDSKIDAMLAAVTKSEGASQFEKSRTQMLEGELLLRRSRFKQAEVAFNAALQLDTGNASAQRGLASVLFESGRYSEALARFEAALGLAPEDLQIQLGIVRSKIRLEQHDDAAKALARLTTSYPDNTAVQYWLGRSKEALGEKDQAETAYKKGVEAGQDVPELVLATVALTRLLGQAGKHDEAKQAIEAAVVRFPNEPRVYRALGELAEGRGNYEDAVTNYDKALELDKGNVGVRFARAIALRKARRFEEAARELDAVEQAEKGYPGLSLERGNLYEAAGRTAEALKAYESALSQAPKDPDLMLRVGCGKANAGRAKEAEELLNKVFAERPMSAEVNFCLGLSQFKDGKDLPRARRTLERALNLDATRPEYHLYYGWASIELKDYPLAGRAFDKALELDQSLADAYWLRGLLRVRQGAVADAERDLKRALLLSPARYEAHATLAEAYLQMGKEGEAIAEFERASAGGVLEPYVEYRYGKLLMDNHRVPEARGHLEKALAAQVQPLQAPQWVWDAHRLLAMALGIGRPALDHWEAFVEHGPSDSPYRVDALRAMKAIMTSLGH